MKIYTEFINFIYDLFLIPVFLFYFLGIPFLLALVLEKVSYALDINQVLAEGIVIFFFMGFFMFRVWRAFDWETKNNMPRWLRWFSKDLKKKIIKK